MGDKLLDLTKKLELCLDKKAIYNVPTMEVKLAVDKSGSMDDEFRAGWVQNTIDLFIAAALKFDDNGSLDVGFFNTGFTETPKAKAEDVGVYVNKHRISAGGGTCFAGAIEAFKGSSVGKKTGGFFGFGGKVGKTKPTYLGLITDGENSDKDKFENELDSLQNTFVQIIAIGNGVDEHYLNYIGEKYPTVEVMYLPNPKSVTDEMFFDLLCNNEFKQFCEGAK